ncbi:DNA damage-regulated autophagy modulator protein 1-like [Anneissia japonica]|uniref:DNA damage-regulated autophagy modulator protein 1-like n=1 Tax=Anneissia japonica TaxID=1529436 RepID=UPI0014257BDD|nr:DNA damage-regulated autophagy modulator protein 1-like [Anneissia japonica]
MDVSYFQQQGMSFVSIALAGVSIATVVTSYTIAVVRGDVQSIFPYISDTGGKPPESCVFGQLLNLTALLLLASAWIRYKQMEELRLKMTKAFGFWNKIGILIAICAALGLSVVANFQDKAVLVVHMIGACTAFIGFVIYAGIHTWISYKICPQFTSLAQCRFRLFLTISGIALVFSTYMAEIAASRQWEKHHVHNDTFQWNKEDGGYAAHLVSTFSEWFLGAAILTFFISYFSDFKKVVIELDMKPKSDPLDLTLENDEYDVAPLNL